MHGSSKNMTKRKIQIIVGLMCIALIGLIGFQWYWIREAIAIRNEQFNHKVAESVQEVVHRLEKQEMMYLLQQRIESEQQKSKLERITQMRNYSVKREASAKKEVAREIQPQPVSKIEVVIGPHGEEVHYRVGSDGVATDVLSPNFRVMVDHQQKIIEEFFQAQEFGMAGMDEFMRRRLEDEKNLGKALKEMEGINQISATNRKGGSGSVQETRENGRQNLSFNPPKIKPRDLKNLPLTSRNNPDKAEILKEVMKDLLYTQRPIQERVNRFLLDTLLKKEFEENGISLPYEFAVQGQGSNALLFATANLKPDDWKLRSYRASLFPNETFQIQNSLFVYFPDQKKHIMSGMGLMFGGSGVLILVVLACFYMAVTTIIRQKKLSDIKNDFINNMTHEFKTPISTIALATEMAQENVVRTNASPRMMRYLGMIREENKRLGTHVEKVLQMALLDKGEVKLKKSLVNVHDLITQALNSQGMQIEQKNGEVEMHFEAEHELVSADEVHLSNILNNLIDNAIKYSPDKLFISIETKNVDHGIEIKVADHGIGMSRDQLQRIFDTFYRVPTGNVHDVKGFGLGLSYVKTMAEAHGGAVKVDSKPGVGSTFSIWLPTVEEV